MLAVRHRHAKSTREREVPLHAAKERNSVAQGFLSTKHSISWIQDKEETEKRDAGRRRERRRDTKRHEERQRDRGCTEWYGSP